jgi:hypothetical protein
MIGLMSTIGYKDQQVVKFLQPPVQHWRARPIQLATILSVSQDEMLLMTRAEVLRRVNAEVVAAKADQAIALLRARHHCAFDDSSKINISVSKLKLICHQIPQRRTTFWELDAQK